MPLSDKFINANIKLQFNTIKTGLTNTAKYPGVILDSVLLN